MESQMMPKQTRQLLENITQVPIAAMIHIMILTAIGIHGGIIRAGVSLQVIIPGILGDILIIIRRGPGGIITTITPIGTIPHMVITLVEDFKKEHSIVGLPTRDPLLTTGQPAELQMISC